MKRSVWIGVLAALTVAVGSTAAQAAPLTLDFTAGIYVGANNEFAFETVDHGVTVNLWSAGGVLSYDAVGGIGIRGFGGDDGEVGNNELVLSGFSPSQHVYEVEIAQLFTGEGVFGSHDEVGYYMLNLSGLWIPFTATNDDGSYTLHLDQSVSSIAFAGDCAGFLCGLDDDFSIKSITVEESVNQSQVPEPASMVLLGSGLLAIAHSRRKKNQAL